MSTYREDIKNKRKSIVLSLLENKPMHWLDLAENLIGKSRWFTTNRNLSDALDTLEKENKISKIVKSSKSIIYMLTEDAEIYLKSFNALRQEELCMPKVLDEIRKSKTELTSEQAKKWIMALIFFGLKNFLDGLEYSVRAEEKWGYHARYMLEHFTDIFGTMILVCGKTYPDLMDSAVDTVKQQLESLIFSYAPKISEVGKV